MIFSSKTVLESLKKNFVQIPGFKSDKKLIVIESDDWGSMRIGTKEALATFEKKGLFTDDPFIQFDTLASNEDLANLFEILSSFKDFTGNSPVITANTNVANPDYEKISDTQFAQYLYESFSDTIKKLGDRGNPIRMWKEGIQRKLFMPQYHGREHLNVGFWMKALKAKHNETLIAFKCNSYGLITNTPFSKNNHYLAALDFYNFSEIEQHNIALKDGIELFKKLFGYKPASFIAPQYIWHTEHEKLLRDSGIKYVQGHRRQILPLSDNINYQKRYHFTGQYNSNNQIYLCRNCYFEPVISEKDWVDSCLNDIKTAFSWKKPAIIGTHRLNYVTKLNNSKINNNLKSLKDLFNQILLKWPDVIFISSNDLGSVIEKS